MDKKKIFGLMFIVISLIWISWPEKDNYKNVKERYVKEISQFNTYCIKCHIDNNDYNAPSIDNKNEWLILWKDLDKAKDKVINGDSGAMPPRGGCKNCSDEDLLNILNYIKAYQSE